MQAGWKAKGLLRPLWHRYTDEKDARGKLAAAVGTTGSTLSAINNGNRNLGWDLAARLVAELNAKGIKVSVLDLGAPSEAQVAARSVAVIDRMAAAEAELARQRRVIAQLRRDLNALRHPRDGGP